MNQDLTLRGFNRLANPDKYSALEERGIYLKAFYLLGAFKIALFRLCSFSVEVWMDVARDELEKAFAFDDLKRPGSFLAIGGHFTRLCSIVNLHLSQLSEVVYVNLIV